MLACREFIAGVGVRGREMKKPANKRITVWYGTPASQILDIINHHGGGRIQRNGNTLPSMHLRSSGGQVRKPGVCTILKCLLLVLRVVEDWGLHNLCAGGFQESRPKKKKKNPKQNNNRLKPKRKARL